MSDIALVANQVRYEQKMYWRNPASAFFTFAFPLMFLVIFASINKDATIRSSVGFRTTSTTSHRSLRSES